MNSKQEDTKCLFDNFLKNNYEKQFLRTNFKHFFMIFYKTKVCLKPEIFVIYF